MTLCKGDNKDDSDTDLLILVDNDIITGSDEKGNKNYMKKNKLLKIKRYGIKEQRPVRYILLDFLINMILWLWLFLIPAGTAVVIAYFRYYSNQLNNIIIPLVLILTGIALGTFLAEYIRRKFGLTYFFSRINASPDFDNLSITNKDKEFLDTKENK